METSYTGIFVGPAKAAAIEQAARTIDGCAIRIIEADDVGAWAVLDVARFAEALARRLGDGTWVWEVQLRNELERGTAESHAGTIRGARWVAATGLLQPRTNETLREEGFIRGGVMEEVALEYVWQYVDLASEPDAPAPELAANDDDGLVEMLIDRLIASGELEVVNHHARRTLVEPLEGCLSASTAREAAGDILSTLVDAPEVVEVYADEATIEALLVELAPHAR